MGFDPAAGDVGNTKVGGGETERGMDLEPEDFKWVTSEVLHVADLCCGGRVVSVMEGGYGEYNNPKPSRLTTRSSVTVTSLPPDAASQQVRQSVRKNNNFKK